MTNLAMHERPTRKGKRITGLDREHLTATVVSRYRKGASIRTIAADLGRSYGNIHRLLTEAGVKLRSRGGWNGNKHKRKS